MTGSTGSARRNVEVIDESMFFKLDEKEQEKAYLYHKRAENLCDLEIGWKPDKIASKGGFLRKVYNMPGKTWFRKVRPLETERFTTTKEWKKLRGPWRHYMAFSLLWGPPGNLFYNMRVPMTVITIVILANAIYGTLSETVNPNLPHWFALGQRSSSYAMTSFLVSLLLGFKINRSFDRWWLARQNFSSVCARVSGLLTSISLAKLDSANATISQREKDTIHRIQRLFLAFPFSIIMTLYSLDRCPLQIRHILNKTDIEWIENTKDAWYFLLCKIHVLISSLTAKNVPDMQRELAQLRVEVHTLLTIKRTHFPYFLSKIPTALLMVYSIAVPMQLFGDIMNHIHDTAELQGDTLRNVLHYWYLAGVLFVFSALILAANEAADLLEDPYYYIPMFDIAESELGKLKKLIQLVDPGYHDMRIKSCYIDGEHETESESEEEHDPIQSLNRTNSWFFKG